MGLQHYDQNRYEYEIDSGDFNDGEYFGPYGDIIKRVYYEKNGDQYVPIKLTYQTWERNRYYNRYETARDVTNPPTTNHVTYNILAERKFKLAALEWLNNGQPKLFKSPGEGNYIVRLMNCSLTPVSGLGRMLHTFSATAYEIESFKISNLVSIGISSTIETNSEMPNQIMTIDLASVATGTNILDEDIVPVSRLEMYDMVPGTMVTINKDVDGVGVDMMIGNTGSLYLDLEDGIYSVEFKDAYTQYLQGYINAFYSPKVVYSNFDRYTTVDLVEVPIRQFFGKNIDVLNRNDSLLGETIEDVLHTVAALHTLRFMRRDIETLYYDGEVFKENNGKIGALSGNIYQSYNDLLNHKNSLDTAAILQLNNTSIYEIRTLSDAEFEPTDGEPSSDFE